MIAVPNNGLFSPLFAGGCGECNLSKEWERMKNPRLDPVGPPDAPVYFLKENPDVREDSRGTFLLDVRFRNAQIPEEWVPLIRIGAITRCYFQYRSPDFQEIQCCEPYWKEDIEKTAPVVVVTFGSAALNVFWPGAVPDRIRGTYIPIRIGSHRCYLYPMMDPAKIQENLNDEKRIRLGTTQANLYKVDMDNLWKDLDSGNIPSLPPEIVPDKGVYLSASIEEARALVAKMDLDKLACDIETVGLKPYQTPPPSAWADRVTSIAISDGEITIAAIPDADWKRFFKEILYGVPWTAHNAMFERLWCTCWYGEEFDFPLRDTMTLHRVWHQREFYQSLDDVTRIHLGVPVKSLTGHSGNMSWELPIPELLRYNAYDAKYTALAEQRMMSYPWTEDALNTVVQLDGLVRPLVRMEVAGLPVNVEYANELEAEFIARAEESRAKIRGLKVVKAWEEKFEKELNLNSPIQIGQILASIPKIDRYFRYTEKTGKISTDDAALSLIPSNITSFPEKVLHFRELNKQVSTYLKPITTGGILDSEGLIHPTYRQTSTATCRLASSDPNIQNWPKRKHKEIRGIVRAPEGMVMLAADFGQLEARVIAMASKDANLIKYQRSSYDIHTFWLKRLLEGHPSYLDDVAKAAELTDEKKIWKAARDKIKTDFVFAAFFGSTEKACAARAGVPPMLMREIFQEFWEEFKGVKEWIDSQRLIYQETGKVWTLSGRARTGALLGNEPINTPIQGTARDIVSQAMIALDECGYTPAIDIHDDETFFLPDDEDLERKIREIADIMVQPRFPWVVVPLIIEMSLGTRWDQLEPIGEFRGEYFES